METTRQNKIARLIQKDLGMIFQSQGRNLFGSAMITVTKVHVAKDLSVARIYLSLFGVKDKEALLGDVRSHTRVIRRELGNREHNQLRIIPELQFYMDDSLDYIDNIDQLLHQ